MDNLPAPCLNFPPCIFVMAWFFIIKYNDYIYPEMNLYESVQLINKCSCWIYVSIHLAKQTNKQLHILTSYAYNFLCEYTWTFTLSKCHSFKYYNMLMLMMRRKTNKNTHKTGKKLVILLKLHSLLICCSSLVVMKLVSMGNLLTWGEGFEICSKYNCYILTDNSILSWLIVFENNILWYYIDSS